MYEYADAEGSEADADGKKFVINSQVSNLSASTQVLIVISELYTCVLDVVWIRSCSDVSQCKTCSIKTPTQDITWSGKSLSDYDRRG